MAGSQVAMAVLGFFLLVAGLWAIEHPNRVDASFSRGTDWLSLPWWTRTVVGIAETIVGFVLVIASIFLS